MFLSNNKIVFFKADQTWVDPWLGAENNYRLSDSLINYLHEANLFMLANVSVEDPQPWVRVEWLDSVALGLTEELKDE